ncbi:hypothetical protein [Plantactinospora sp. CA-290183]|uniref:hypothetical protein n=1 Tax=Plantactinospora sp. CA-290183 TaxID=3240006 RepID=UPI003D917B34
MTGSAGAGATREILVVLGLAGGGLLLAVLAAFTPWYGESAGSGRVEVVEMHAPTGQTEGDEVVATR